MALSPQRVRALAELAGLAVSDEERIGLQHDLNAMLAFVEELVGLSIEGPEAGDDATPLRPDDTPRAMPRDDLLACVPEGSGGFVVVPGRSGRAAARASDEGESR